MDVSFWHFSQNVFDSFMGLLYSWLYVSKTKDNNYFRNIAFIYVHDRVWVFFKNLCIIVLWTKVASALEGLKTPWIKGFFNIEINHSSWHASLIYHPQCHVALCQTPFYTNLQLPKALEIIRLHRILSLPKAIFTWFVSVDAILFWDVF